MPKVMELINTKLVSKPTPECVQILCLESLLQLIFHPFGDSICLQKEKAYFPLMHKMQEGYYNPPKASTSMIENEKKNVSVFG